MVVHYLYHLDYSTKATAGQDYTNGYATGAPEHDGYTIKDTQHDGVSEDAMIEQAISVQGPEEPGSVKLSSKEKKKNRKKNKKQSSSSVLTITTEANGSPVKDADLSIGTQCTEEYAVPVESQLSSSLVTHAKVYALSKKYNINGLKLLALEKFKAEADQEWDTINFLLAAKEIYTSTSADDQDIRDTVTTVVYQHPEILDRDETQELFKGLDLGFDVLKRVRAKGGFL